MADDVDRGDVVFATQRVRDLRQARGLVVQHHDLAARRQLCDQRLPVRHALVDDVDLGRCRNAGRRRRRRGVTRLFHGGAVELAAVMRRFRGIDMMAGRFHERGAVVHLARLQRIAVGTRTERVR